MSVPIIVLIITGVFVMIIYACYRVYISPESNAQPAKRQYNQIYHISGPQIEYVKKPLMTNNEIMWYQRLWKYCNKTTNLYVFPQICLASIVDKKNKNEFRGELFRIVDFVMVDDNQNIIAIEINDKSHHIQERIDRDEKVKHILYDAGIDLITFGSMDSEEQMNNILNHEIRRMWK